MTFFQSTVDFAVNVINDDPLHYGFVDIERMDAGVTDIAKRVLVRPGEKRRLALRAGRVGISASRDMIVREAL